MSLTRASSAIAALALGGLAVLGAQAPAFAAPGDCPVVGQSYAPGSGCTSNPGAVSDSTLAPGQPAVISAAGFAADSPVTLTLHSTPVSLGSFTANSSGVVTAKFTIPTSTPAGNHELWLTGVNAAGAAFTVVVPISVDSRFATGATGATTGSTGSTGSTSASSLPFTGAEIGAIAVLGLGLVGAGGAAIYTGRRRRVSA